jgi:hypothetical protein
MQIQVVSCSTSIEWEIVNDIAHASLVCLLSNYALCSIAHDQQSLVNEFIIIC